MELVKKAPKLYQKVKEYEEEYYEEGFQESFDLLDNFVEDCCSNNFSGLSSILYEVIKEVEEIELFVCSDFDGKDYLIYPPVYPWGVKNLSKKEQSLTEEQLVELYAKYLHIVTDEDLIVEYQSVANGG